MGESVATATPYVLDGTLLSNFNDTFTANLAVILPVALGIFGIMFAIRLFPRLIKMFK